MASTAIYRKARSITPGMRIALMQPPFIGTAHYDPDKHGRAGERGIVSAIDSRTHHGCALWFKRQDGTLLLVGERHIAILPTT